MYDADQAADALEELRERRTAKPDIVRRLAEMCLGWPYVFGALGEFCAPAVRRKYAGYHPEYQSKIYGACPVLSGKQSACDGCPWDGRRCFDCRGFTRWLLAQAGITLAGGGATTQWETGSNWAAKGEIKDIPRGLVCCVFKRKESKMSHTGMHMKDGRIIHCSTTVKEDALPGKPAWTHWGIPAGLYTDEELRAAGLNVKEGSNVQTLRKGSSGEAVKALQALLNRETNAGLAEDGIFGAKTETAVKAYQAAHGLTADGVAGPKTLGAMGRTADEPTFEAAEEGYNAAGEGILVSAPDWKSIAAAFSAMAQVLKKYEVEGLS